MIYHVVTVDKIFLELQVVWWKYWVVLWSIIWLSCDC